MPCDCKANKQILALGRVYGRTVSRTRKDIIKDAIWRGIQYIFLAILALIFLPIIVLYLLYKVIVKKDKVVHLDKLLNNGRKQQDIQDKD